jgi:hypothetical protein
MDDYSQDSNCGFAIRGAIPEGGKVLRKKIIQNDSK